MLVAARASRKRKAGDVARGPHARPFRFGVVSEVSLEPTAWLAHVRRIEELGFATLLLRDHLVPDFFGEQLAPLPALTAAAMATTTLRVGTLVLDNDFRHPAVLAKEVATLDALSGGRVEVGVGAGWLRAEYARSGIRYDPAGVRIGRLEEAVRVLKGLLSGTTAPFSVSGQHYVIDGLTCYPPVVQRPHPPLLIGGGKPRVLRLAGREADIVSILTTSVATGVVVDDPAERLPAAVAQKLAWVREGAGARYDSLELSLIPTVVVTADRHGATERLRDERGWRGVTASDVLAMPSVFIGTPEEIAEDMLARRACYGISYYVVSDRYLAAFAPVVGLLRAAS
jgi:probable F420-dependent oxidoreductase